VLSVVADLSEPDAVDRLADGHLAASDRTDCLVLNAGMGLTGPWQDFPARRLTRMLQVNVETPYRLVQRLLPSLRETAAGSPERGARVFAISSMAGVVSQPHSSAYGASKAALISLCETLNVEESERGICATAISPGFVDTDMTAWVRDRVDPAQMIRASDVAELVLALIRMSRWAVGSSVRLATSSALSDSSRQARGTSRSPIRTMGGIPRSSGRCSPRSAVPGWSTATLGSWIGRAV